MFESFSVPKKLRPKDPRFTCGPSLIPPQAVRDLAQTETHLLGTSHRKSAVKNLVAAVQRDLAHYFQLPEGYEVVLGNGGATMLFDALGLGAVEQCSAHFSCGEFSHKWFHSHQLIPWIEAREISVKYGQGMTPRFVPEADMICTTLNETSTGVMVDSYSQLAGSPALVAVDATSGAGQIFCDFNQVDIFFFSPRKFWLPRGGCLWPL